MSFNERNTILRSGRGTKGLFVPVDMPTTRVLGDNDIGTKIKNKEEEGEISRNQSSSSSTCASANASEVMGGKDERA